MIHRSIDLLCKTKLSTFDQIANVQEEEEYKDTEARKHSCSRLKKVIFQFHSWFV